MESFSSSEIIFTCANLNNEHAIRFIFSLNVTNAAKELLSLKRCPANLTLQILKNDLLKLKKTYEKLRKRSDTEAERDSFHSFCNADYIYPDPIHRVNQKKVCPALDKIHDAEVLQTRAIELETELTEAKDLREAAEESKKRKVDELKEVKADNRNLKAALESKDDHYKR